MKWIPATAVPLKTFVLVAFKGGAVNVARTHDGETWYGINGGMQLIGKPTHYMPLPEPPA